MEKVSGPGHEKRLVWLDVIRGFSIIMVIYFHLLMIEKPSAINELYRTTRMPVFFFISGFLIYSITYDLPLLWRRLKKRLMQQLYPTIIFFSLFVILFVNCDFSYIFNTFKAGFWFTYVSVLYFFTLAPILVAFTLIGLKNRTRILVLVVLMIASLLVQKYTYNIGFFSTKIGGLLSFEHYIGYLKFLFAGAAFRILWNDSSDKLINTTVFILCVLAFAVCYYFKGLLSILTPFLGIYLMLFMAYKLTNRYIESKAIKMFSYLGAVTLEIYLLHPFVLNYLVHPISSYHDFIIGITNTPWEFPVLFSICMAVAAVCLSIVWLFKRLKIYKYIFGK